MYSPSSILSVASCRKCLECKGWGTTLFDPGFHGEGVGEAPVAFDLASLTFVQLLDDGQAFEGTAQFGQCFPQVIPNDCVKGLCGVNEECI